MQAQVYSFDHLYNPLGSTIKITIKVNTCQLIDLLVEMTFHAFIQKRKQADDCCY